MRDHEGTRAGGGPPWDGDLREAAMAWQKGRKGSSSEEMTSATRTKGALVLLPFSLSPVLLQKIFFNRDGVLQTNSYFHGVF